MSGILTNELNPSIFWGDINILGGWRYFMHFNILKGYSEYNLYWSEVFFNNTRVLFTQKKENEEQGFPIESVLFHHLNEDTLENFKLPQTNVFTISTSNSDSTLYYADYSNSNFDALFYKLDCKKLEIEYLFKLSLNDFFDNILLNVTYEDVMSFLLTSIKIIGIDDQYMIFSYENEEHKNNWFIFDSRNKSILTIPTEPIMDHLERLDIWKNNNLTYLVFKIGQYNVKEKESKWRSGCSDLPNEKVLLEEKLIIIEAQEFIYHVRKEVLPLNKYTVMTCTGDKALVKYYFSQNKVLCFEHLFETESTSITAYSLSGDIIGRSVVVTGLHSNIYTVGNCYFSIRDCYFDEGEGITVTDLLADEIVFQDNTQERVLFLTNKALFTYFYTENGDIRLKIKTLDGKEDKVLGEGRNIFVDQARECILIIE